MGLDTSHGAWHGAYSSFNSWRTAIAKMVDIELDSMRGFGGDKEWDYEDPLTALLYHSDCDGELSPKECAGIAMRLRELIPNITDPWVQEKAIQFADGCDLAAAENETLEFG